MATITLPPVSSMPRSPKPTRSQTLFWLGLSLAIAAMLGIMQMQKAFGAEYVVQDDVRQHVFWMQRFLDPALFPNDLIADYFQSVAPWGFTTLYHLAAQIGLDPAWFNKILPIFIWLVTTAYCFGATLQILPVPAAGFLAATLLNFSTFQADDILSATPRAFTYPLFVAFLYYLLRRSPLPCWLAIGLQGVFYPQIMLVSAGVLVLRLIHWQQWRPHLQGDRQDWLLSGVGLGIAGAASLFYLLGGANEFGPVLSVPEAKQMAEFWDDGRTTFFTNNPFDYWLLGSRSGLLPRLSRILKPLVILSGLFLPKLLTSPDRFPLGQFVTPRVRSLTDILFASLGLFLAAHLLLFKLHHPSRYTQHSVRVVLAISAGVALVILLDALFQWANRPPDPRPQTRRRLIAWGTTLSLGLYLLLFPIGVPIQQSLPFLEPLFPSRTLPAYVYGEYPAIYKFFAQQPKDTLVASLSKEVSNIPSFSRRSILSGWEYGIPYHKGYYDEFKARSRALYIAQYSPDPALVQQFTNQYGVDFWLLERDAFTPQKMQKPWGQQFPNDLNTALATQQQGQSPVLQQAIARCTTFQNERFVILPADCVIAKR